LIAISRAGTGNVRIRTSPPGAERVAKPSCYTPCPRVLIPFTRSSCRIVLLTAIILFPLFALGAGVDSARMEIIVPPSAAVSSDALRASTSLVAGQELDWRLDFTDSAAEIFRIELSEIIFDDSLFAGKHLLQVAVGIRWRDSEIVRTIACLVPEGTSWETSYRQELIKLFRSDMSDVFPSSDILGLTHAMASGYWTTSDATGMTVGERVWVTDARGTEVALVTVVDRFDFPGDPMQPVAVTEFSPLWANRPIVAGMPLVKQGSGLSFSLAFPVSLERIGMQGAIELPVRGTLFRFSGKVGVDALVDNSAFEMMLEAGLASRFALGIFGSSPDVLGAWWTNLQTAALFHMGVGTRWHASDGFGFMLGAEIEFQLSHQSSAHWYWGVSAGYRYRVLVESGIGSTVQGNERGFTLSPIVGWLW